MEHCGTCKHYKHQGKVGGICELDGLYTTSLCYCTEVERFGE